MNVITYKIITTASKCSFFQVVNPWYTRTDLASASAWSLHCADVTKWLCHYWRKGRLQSLKPTFLPTQDQMSRQSLSSTGKYYQQKCTKTGMSCRQGQVSINFTSRNRVTAKKVDTDWIIIHADFFRDLLMDVIWIHLLFCIGDPTVLLRAIYLHVKENPSSKWVITCK
jgi:hypothetical protein